MYTLNSNNVTVKLAWRRKYRYNYNNYLIISTCDSYPIQSTHTDVGFVISYKLSDASGALPDLLYFQDAKGGLYSMGVLGHFNIQRKRVYSPDLIKVSRSVIDAFLAESPDKP